MLVGHGHRALGALIVPDAEALEELAVQQGEGCTASTLLLAAREGCALTCRQGSASWWWQEFDLAGALPPLLLYCFCLYCTAGRDKLQPEEVRQLVGQEFDLASALPPCLPPLLVYCLYCTAGHEQLQPAEMRQLVGQEVRSLLANRIRWEHVAEFEVLEEPFRCVGGY